MVLNDIKGALSIFMVILYMGKKRLPKMYSIWAKSNKLFYYPIIVGLFFKKRFFKLIWCLHLSNPTTYILEKNNL